MVKIFKFEDTVLVDQPALKAAKDQAVDILNRGRKPKLRTEIDATHAGVITNGRVYPGKHVAQGYKTFFSKDRGGSAEYDKPVLKHHSLENDPIGRVIGASFTPFKSGSDFENDFLHPDPMGSRGSGVVTVTAQILDEESIEKILDGRYLSVSAGHSSPQLQCSVCGSSILKCPHEPGKTYDEEGDSLTESEGTLCYAVTGPLTYHEISFVNMPAQPPAKLMSFRWEDSFKQKLDKEDLIITASTRGKKNVVRAFSLTDEDGELNLLTGGFKATKEKTVVSMASTSTESSQKTDAGETKKVHQDSGNQNIESANVETKQTDKIVTPNSEDNMDKPNETQLDPKVLATSLQALAAEGDSLKSQVAANKLEIENLKKTIESKDSEIKRLSEDRVKLQADMSVSLATALASFRIRLGKPDTAGLDSKQKFDEFVTKLAKRTSESLRDSLEDIILEASQDKVEEKPPVSETKKLTETTTKVDSAVLAKGGKPSETKESKSHLDQVLD